MKTSYRFCSFHLTLTIFSLKKWSLSLPSKLTRVEAVRDYLIYYKHHTILVWSKIIITNNTDYETTDTK